MYHHTYQPDRPTYTCEGPMISKPLEYLQNKLTLGGTRALSYQVCLLRNRLPILNLALSALHTAGQLYVPCVGILTLKVAYVLVHFLWKMVCILIYFSI